MTEQVKIKSTGQMGCVEYYEGAGMYAIKLEDGTYETFHEHDIECLNFEPYLNNFTKETLLKAIKDALTENNDTYVLGIFNSIEMRERFAEALTDEVAIKLNLSV